MSIAVFVGPTLGGQAAGLLGDAIRLPPAAQGDIYRAAQAGPRAIGLIDGYFSGVPSVWHKEILWALSQGIPVFGSASMGALRAAELKPFGMRGTGRIFEAYRDGVLEDDDEVAVVHGPAELDFLAASEPMVNIRATLQAAESAGVLSAASRGALERFAKSLFYPERSWPAVLEAGRAQGVTPAEVAALGDWLPQGRVDQKRADAIEMLAEMREMLDEPLSVSFRFEWTHHWQGLVARAGTEAAPGNGAAPTPYRRILDELRLQGPDVYEPIKMRALARALAGSVAGSQWAPVSTEAKRDTLTRLRTARALFSRSDLDAWMVRNHVDGEALERLIDEEARLTASARQTEAALDRYLVGELRLSGAYERLAERSLQKLRALAERTERGDGADGAPIHPTQLRLWFFEQHLRRPVPDNIAGFARDLGFASLAEFDAALSRELLYAQHTRNPDG